MSQDDLLNPPTRSDELEDDLGPGDDPSLMYDDLEDDAQDETTETTDPVDPDAHPEVTAEGDKADDVVTPETTEDDTLPAPTYKAQLPDNLYSDEEKAWLLRSMDDPDPEVRFQADEFRTARRIEYNNRAMLVAQAQMASVPQAFAAVHGPVIADYLNTRVAPERRGTPEALKEAQYYAVYQRGVQIGDGPAFKEAYELITGRPLNVPVQVPQVQQQTVVHKAPPAPRQPMAPGARIPTSPIVAAPGGPQTRTRGERAYERTMRGLGINEDD